MKSLAGAAILISVLHEGPTLGAHGGWPFLAGWMIGLGMLLIVWDLFGNAS